MLIVGIGVTIRMGHGIANPISKSQIDTGPTILTPIPEKKKNK